MSFMVQVQGLGGLPALLTRLASDANSSAAYLRDGSATITWRSETGFVPAGNLITYLHPEHQRLTGMITEHLDQRVGTAASRCAAQVSRALDYYRHTDSVVAAQVDAAWPGPRDPSFVAGAGAISAGASVEFSDVVRPTATLAPTASGHEELTYSVDLSVSLVSPATAMRGTVWFFTEQATRAGLLDRPIDVMEELARPVAGDWPGLARFAQTLRNTAAACAGMGENLGHSQSAVAAVWTGHAADSCREYLMRFGQVLTTTNHQVNRVATLYRDLAHDLMVLAAKLGDAIGQLFDIAVVALLEVEVAIAASTTGVGVSVWALVAYDVWLLYQSFCLAKMLVDSAEVTVHAFREASRLVDLAIATPPFAMPELPEPAVLPTRH